jgi:hypothetical protein
VRSARAGTCLFELFTGAVMFPGDDNNDMLWRIIEVKGMFPKRLIRRHFQASEELGKEAHFDRDTFRFKRHLLDPVRYWGVWQGGWVDRWHWGEGCVWCVVCGCVDVWVCGCVGVCCV